MSTRVSESEWRAAAIDRYGEKPSAWKFRCPVCKHVAAVEDWETAKAPEGAIAFSCIGRYLPGEANDAFARKQKAPCNYAGGGLFKLNPITVVDSAGREHSMFDFADRPLATAPSSSKGGTET